MVEVREQAVEGGEVELSCLVPRSRPAAVLRWYRDRKELKGTAWGGGRGGAGRERRCRREVGLRGQGLEKSAPADPGHSIRRDGMNR